MQSGSLKDKFIDYLKSAADFLWEILNTEIFDVKKTLYSLAFYSIEKVAGLKNSVKTYTLVEQDAECIPLDFEVKEARVNLLKPDPVVFRSVKTVIGPDVVDCSKKISIEPKVNESESLFTQMKWNFTNLDISVAKRKYDVNLVSNLHITGENDFELGKTKVRKVAKGKIAMQRKLKLTEEITEIIPYTKTLKKGILYKIPVFKDPVSKSSFSSQEMDHFKEILANQSKTRKTNIEMVNIYDKFNIDMYSNISQDPGGKKLKCYLNEKKSSLGKDELFYLLIGKKRDTNAVVKALAKLPI